MGSHFAMQHQNQHPDVSVFIRNLNEATDGKTLNRIFADFGNIVSCKLAYDEKGKSKGYAFVQFDSEQAARNAIEKVNGMLVDNRSIYVGKFIPRKGRNKERDERNIYTNLYVKNFGNDFSEEQLRELFEPYGKIKSHKIMTNLEGNSKGFGFVAFEKAEYAEDALIKLNGKVLANGHKLYVARAQKKAERQQELERQFEEQEERKRRENNNGLNLYVKNLDDNITDDQLRNEFSPYGPISSARIMTDSSGRSKGFGFVRFVSPVDACFAAAGLNGRMLGTKPLFVSLAQRKNERRALLVAQHMRQRLQATESLYVTSKRFYRRPLVAGSQAHLRAPAPSPASSCSQVGVSASAVHWTPSASASASPSAAVYRSNEMPKQQPQNVWRSSSLARKVQLPRLSNFENFNRLNGVKSQVNLRFSAPMSLPVMIQTPPVIKSPTPSQTIINSKIALALPPPPPPPPQLLAATATAIPVKLTEQSMSQLHQKPPLATVTPLTQYTKFSQFSKVESKITQIPSSSVMSLQNYNSYISLPTSPPSESISSRSPPSSESISSGSGNGSANDSFSGASLHEEKQRIGERLYHRVEKFYPKLAGKITGMLLEMDNSDLYYLLDNSNALHDKVEEAYQVYMTYISELHNEGRSNINVNINPSCNGGSVSGSPISTSSSDGSVNAE